MNQPPTSAEPCSKNVGETSIVLWIMAREQRIPTSHNPNQTRAALWRIFHQIKLRQPLEKQDSMQTMIGTSKRLDSFLVSCFFLLFWSMIA
jgi:hypothetical protein